MRVANLPAAVGHPDQDQRLEAFIIQNALTHLRHYVSGMHLGHDAALRGALAALLGTALHLGAVELAARCGALGAGIGADVTDRPVPWRASQHEIGAGRADLGAIQQGANVRCLGVLAAPGQTVRKGLETNFVT